MKVSQLLRGGQLQCTYRAGYHFAELGVLLMVLHVEYTFGLSKAASYVMVTLVGVPTVNLGEFRGIAD